jgi:DNA-binding CsgD family transcriptional regulator
VGRAAVEVLESLPPGRELAMAYSNQAHLRMLAYDEAAVVAWGEKAIALAERCGDTETLVYALESVGVAKSHRGDVRGRSAMERSLALAREAGLEAHVARAYANLAVIDTAEFRFAAADRSFEEGIAYCVARDLDHYQLYMLGWQAIARLHQGRWAEAAEAAGVVVRHPTASPVARIHALVALGRLQARRGDAEATGTLDEALALATKTDALQRLGFVYAARAEAAWLAGDPDRTRVEASTVFDLAVRRREGWLVGEMAYWRQQASGLDAPGPWVAEPYALQLRGDWAAAAASWRALGCPYEAARALADGDEAAMKQALVEFERLGARPAAQVVARRLRRHGTRGIPRGPRPATRSHPAGLTAREAEILHLLGEGLRDTEIATRLHLSPRTVQHHVSAILGKLGVRSRSEATRLAAGLGACAHSG